LKHFTPFNAKVTFLFKAFEIKWGKKASILGDHSIKVMIGSILAKDINSSILKFLNMPFFSLIQDFVLRNDF
jgi:hypothetical protein